MLAAAGAVTQGVCGGIGGALGVCGWRLGVCARVLSVLVSKLGRLRVGRLRVPAHAGWASWWCGWCACVPLVGRAVVAWLSLVFVSAPFFFGQCGGIGRHDRLKSGCPVGRAGSTPATGTRGSETAEYGCARVRVVADIWACSSCRLVSPVGRWCLALATGAWVLVARCACSMAVLFPLFWTVILRGAGSDC